MKIIFFGSDEFAVLNLQGLLDDQKSVVACVTHPDRPKGRGLKMTASSVKLCAGKKGLTVFQPEDIKDKDFISQLKRFTPDLFVVIAYGKILPPEVLAVPQWGAINAHASLLPKYRGAAPINWAIIKGEALTGVSFIKMNEQMDAGDILHQMRMPISEEDTAVTLKTKLAHLSAEGLCRVIESLEKKTCHLDPQERAAVTFAPKLTKELGCIDWRSPAQDIHNLVRGLIPWPCAYTSYGGRALKILKTRVVAFEAKGSPGEIVALDKEGFVVAASVQGLLIQKVHPSSGREMDAKSFCLGHKIEVGRHLR